MIDQPHSVDIRKIFKDGTLLDQAMCEAARDARLLHKRMGVAMSVWDEDKQQVAYIQPEDIVVDIDDKES